MNKIFINCKQNLIFNGYIINYNVGELISFKNILYSLSEINEVVIYDIDNIIEYALANSDGSVEDRKSLDDIGEILGLFLTKDLRSGSENSTNDDYYDNYAGKYYEVTKFISDVDLHNEVIGKHNIYYVTVLKDSVKDFSTISLPITNSMSFKNQIGNEITDYKIFNIVL